MMTKEEVAQVIAYCDEQYVKQKVEGRDVTIEQVATEIRELLNELYKRYYENFTFRDLIPKA